MVTSPNSERSAEDGAAIQNMSCEDLDKKLYEGKYVCIACGSENIMLYWEPRYKGFRGTCNDCKTNWAES